MLLPLVSLGCTVDIPEDGPLQVNTDAVVETDDAEANSSSSDEAGPGAEVDSTAGEKLDVGEGDSNDSGNGSQDAPCVEGDFDFIWIADSSSDELSKVDTETAVELARYVTGPGDSPNPSRTSVNLQGDVAVANRHLGGVTKFSASLDRCVDRNGDGVIQTSSGLEDVLPWPEDECMLWNYPLPGKVWEDATGGPRGLAWDANAIRNPDGGCRPEPRLWVGWLDLDDRSSAVVVRLDGETGEELDRVSLPDWSGNWGHGPYGGAVDSDGGFWAVDTSHGLAHIDGSTLDVRRWDDEAGGTFYGIAVDANDTVWLGGYDGKLYSFDPEQEAFSVAAVMVENGGAERLRGIAIDQEQQLWMANNFPCGLAHYDIESGTVVDAAIELPDCGDPVGVSIDDDGYVWVVDAGADRAYRVDPRSYELVTVDTLTGPYTYSDMTGSGLRLVSVPPVE